MVFVVLVMVLVVVVVSLFAPEFCLFLFYDGIVFFCCPFGCVGCGSVWRE